MGGTKPFDMLGHYEEGMKKISSSDLNTIIKGVKMFRNLSAQPPLGVHVSEESMSLYLMDEFIELFLAMIVNEGPASEANYTDQRYWFHRVYCSNSTGAATTDMTFVVYPAAHQNYIYATATNLGEVISESHTVGDDISLIVPIFSVYDKQSPPIKRYYFNMGVPFSGIRPGKITSLTQVDGPPSAHLYAGNYIDAAGGGWGVSPKIPVLERHDSGVVYLPMEVDDYVAVVVDYNSGTPVERGILGGEAPDFDVC